MSTPNRVTEDTLAEMNGFAEMAAHQAAGIGPTLDWSGRYSLDVPALVNEFRRLRRIIDLIGQSQSDIVQVVLYNAVMRASEASADAEDA